MIAPLHPPRPPSPPPPPSWYGKKSPYFILDDEGKPRAVGHEEHFRWMVREDARRVLIQTQVGGVEVSTVFLGIAHNHLFGNGAPLLWETMVFGGELDEEGMKYASAAEARAGHAKCVELVKANQKGSEGGC